MMVNHVLCSNAKVKCLNIFVIMQNHAIVKVISCFFFVVTEHFLNYCPRPL